MPELVLTNEEGIKSVAYGKLTALLIEVNKAQETKLAEQQSQIEQLQATASKIEQLEASVNELKQSLRSFEPMLNSSK